MCTLMGNRINQKSEKWWMLNSTYLFLEISHTLAQIRLPTIKLIYCLKYIEIEDDPTITHMIPINHIIMSSEEDYIFDHEISSFETDKSLGKSLTFALV